MCLVFQLHFNFLSPWTSAKQARTCCKPVFCLTFKYIEKALKPIPPKLGFFLAELFCVLCLVGSKIPCGIRRNTLYDLFYIGAVYLGIAETIGVNLIYVMVELLEEIVILFELLSCVFS